MEIKLNEVMKLFSLLLFSKFQKKLDLMKTHESEIFLLISKASIE